ncbi:hypothetical protein [Kribbella sp. VKM Ac-2568]|uniref:hypothetical protein n=1 Tax=Kribbella sp. VKM Ac-2568 TaxID=2512219 RepID=UPI0018EEAAFC|nr:hypothetical protein [Kribbella sp. VKM Ac-2568]
MSADLALHQISDHAHEAARVVRASAASPVEALRDHFLAGLERRDPVTGLNDRPEVLAYYRLRPSTRRPARTGGSPLGWSCD